MTETYAIFDGDELVQIYETADGIEGIKASIKNEGIKGTPFLVPTYFEGRIGQKKREFDTAWKLRPIKDRVKEGLTTLPAGKAIDEKTGELRDKTVKEKIDTGEIKIPRGQMFDANTDAIVSMPWVERVASGQYTKEEWLNEVVRPMRNCTLDEVDRVYCNPERWSGYSDTKKAEWSAYKQALRDLPASLATVSEPEDIAFPPMPK